jgi:hypothetical protein
VDLCSEERDGALARVQISEIKKAGKNRPELLLPLLTKDAAGTNEFPSNLDRYFSVKN